MAQIRGNERLPESSKLLVWVLAHLLLFKSEKEHSPGTLCLMIILNIKFLCNPIQGLSLKSRRARKDDGDVGLHVSPSIPTPFRCWQAYKALEVHEP